MQVQCSAVQYIRSLSTDDGEARDDAKQKMDLNFAPEFRR